MKSKPDQTATAPGQPRRVGRPRGVLVSEELVVSAALDIIDREGSQALSIRKLAAKIGVHGPALYHHFDNKDAILEAVARRILRDLPAPRSRTESWQLWAVRTMVSYRESLLGHPNRIDVSLAYGLPDFFPAESITRVKRAMASAGIAAKHVGDILHACRAHVVGSVLIELAEDDAASNRLGSDKRFLRLSRCLVDGLEHRYANHTPGQSD